MFMVNNEVKVLDFKQMIQDNNQIIIKDMLKCKNYYKKQNKMVWMLFIEI